MRVKACVLVSVCYVLVTASSIADSYTLSLPSGYSLIANQLDSTLPGGNTLNNIWPNAANGTAFYKYSCSGWTSYVYSTDDGQWDPDGNATLNPGEGARIYLPSPATITFTGTPHVPVLPVVLPCGCNAYNLLSRQTTNAPTTFQDLTGFNPAEGTRLYRLSPGASGCSSPLVAPPCYTVYTFSAGIWDPATPSLNLGESAFIYTPCSNAAPCCPDAGGVKYLQIPDFTNGIDVNATFSPPDPKDGYPWVLADDFPCTTTGPITDIHIWGSWLNDAVDTNASFTLAIWTDVASGTNGANYSHPGQRLWTQTYGNGQYTLCPYANQFEDFYNGDGSIVGVDSLLGSSSNLFYLCFDASPTNTFYQQGTTSAPTNYWLSVTLESPGTTPHFGWKSSSTAYNDAAVAAFNGNFYPQPGDWHPMTDPNGIALSMAFKITTATNSTPPSTNCCDNCSPPYPLSYTVTVNPGFNYLADNLCQGTNNSLNDVLTGVPDGTEFFTWDAAAQAYTPAQTYSLGSGWFDSGTGNPSTNTLVPGEGFVLNSPSGAPFTLTIQGCQPHCPPPCVPPTNALSLVGQIGLGNASITNALGVWPTTWTNLFGCPPPCGAQMEIWNPATDAFTVYNYANGVWTPFEPGIGAGQSAFVSVRPNTNCCPSVTNVLLNTGYNQNSNTVYGYGQADAYWWVTKDPTLPPTTVPRPATVIQANPAWKPAQPNSQWISSYPSDADNVNGEYDFETYFCLTTNNATNLVLNICLRADDEAGAYLNGNLIPLTPPNTTFGAPNPACGTANIQSWFRPGLNVVQVRVTNVYAVAMGLNAEVSVTGSGLIGASAPCCHPNSGISGQKFFDLNNNGVRDAGEPALSGWTIHLSNGDTATPM